MGGEELMVACWETIECHIKHMPEIATGDLGLMCGIYVLK